MKIAIGSDHAGYPLKESLKSMLEGLCTELRDFGCASTEPVDYPDYAAAVGTSVSRGHCDKGILVCGTGIGIAIAANKIKGIRAAPCSDLFTAEMSRRHNDANVLALGARVVDEELARQILLCWLETPFDQGRHLTRVLKIQKLDSSADSSAPAQRAAG